MLARTVGRNMIYRVAEADAVDRCKTRILQYIADYYYSLYEPHEDHSDAFEDIARHCKESALSFLPFSWTVKYLRDTSLVLCRKARSRLKGLERSKGSKLPKL